MQLIPWKLRERGWEPFKDLLDLQKEMNRLFSAPLSQFSAFGSEAFRNDYLPALDIHDSKENVRVTVDLPGMSKDEIRVSMENHTLVISGEKKKETHDKDKNFVREERFRGSFSRAIALPTDVEADKVKASYKDGVL